MRNANRRRRMLLLSPTASKEDDSSFMQDEVVVPENTALNKAVNKFRRACGAEGYIHIQVSGPGIDDIQRFTFQTPFVVIGRSRRADLRLNHPDVSLRHSYVQMIEGRLYCVDLQSRTGTAHERGKSREELIEEDEAIRIGPYHLHILDGSNGDEVDLVESGSSPQLAILAADELVRANVEVLNSKGNSRRFRPVEEAITLVGNAHGSHLRLKDNSISKTHCSLVRTSDALWCVDLLGRGGTRLNGAEIRIGRLHDGDLLHIGKAKLRIHYSAADDAPPQVTPESSTKPHSEAPAVEPPKTQSSPPAENQSPPAAEPTPAAMPSLDQLIPQQLFGNMALPPMPPMPTLPTPSADVQLPSAPGTGTAAERNVSEAFVMSLVNQFGQMQQQMYQQSQQAMMMLVNMFSSLHQNHMDLIRDDLNRVHEITAELQAVQTQMQASQAAATPVDFVRDAHSETTEHVQEAVISQPVPEKPAADESWKKRTDPSDRPLSEPAAKPEAGLDRPSETEPPPVRQRADHAGVRTHTLLSERLAELESERNSRWHKIMQTLKGIGG